MKKIYKIKTLHQNEELLLGTFDVEQRIASDFYYEMFIGTRQEDGKRYLVLGTLNPQAGYEVHYKIVKIVV